MMKSPSRRGMAVIQVGCSVSTRGAQLFLALLALAVVLAGCAESGDDEGHAPPAVNDFPVVTQDSALPLEAYVLSTAQLAELKDLYRVMVTSCANRFGGEPLAVAPGTEKLVEDGQLWGGRFGTLTMDHASSLGYHAGAGDPVLPSFGLFANEGDEPLATILYGPDREVVGEQGAGERPDIPGLPDEGCVGEVDRSLGGDPLATVPEQIDKLRLKSFRDDRTQKAVRKWSECMADAGFKYKSVDDPIDQFGDGRALSEEEISVAVSDVECTKASRWRDISFAIEKAYQEAELKENPEYWASVKANAESIYQEARRAAVEGER